MCPTTGPPSAALLPDLGERREEEREAHIEGDEVIELSVRLAADETPVEVVQDQGISELEVEREEVETVVERLNETRDLAGFLKGMRELFVEACK